MYVTQDLKTSTCTETDENPEEMSNVLRLLRKCNNFLFQGMKSRQGDCRPLIVEGKQVGLIRPDVAIELAKFPKVFVGVPYQFVLNPQLTTYESRSEAIAEILEELKKDDILIALRSWRNECYNVYTDFGDKPLFKIERAAATMMGIRCFGVSVFGFTRGEDGEVTNVWLQKRADNKPTYPGQMDTMVAGGITAGLSRDVVLVKESQEEASIPDHIISKAKSAGCVSTFLESDRGIHANTDFVYDLQVPANFVPHNSDGEVQSFECVPVQDLLPRVLSSKYKQTSIPVAIDFLVRHGLLQEPNIPAVQELLHVPLHFIYSSMPLPEGEDQRFPNSPSNTEPRHIYNFVDNHDNKNLSLPPTRNFSSTSWQSPTPNYPHICPHIHQPTQSFQTTPLPQCQKHDSSFYSCKCMNTVMLLLNMLLSTSETFTKHQSYFYHEHHKL